MDNFSISVKSYGRIHFGYAMHLAIREADFQVKYYAIRSRNRFIFFRYDPPKRMKNYTIHQLPSRMEPDDYIEFAWSWLVGEADYGDPPDVDGDVFKGFKVSTDEWGMVDGMWQAFIAIEPTWGVECDATAS